MARACEYGMSIPRHFFCENGLTNSPGPVSRGMFQAAITELGFTAELLVEHNTNAEWAVPFVVVFFFFFVICCFDVFFHGGWEKLKEKKNNVYVRGKE